MTPTPTPSEAPNTGGGGGQVLWLHGMCQSGRQLGGIDHPTQDPRVIARMLLGLAICHVHNDPGMEI